MLYKSIRVKLFVQSNTLQQIYYTFQRQLDRAEEGIGSHGTIVI